MQSVLMVGPTITKPLNATNSSKRRLPGLRPTGIVCHRSNLGLQVLPVPFLSLENILFPSEMMRKTYFWDLFLISHLSALAVLGLVDAFSKKGHGSGLMDLSGLMTTFSVASVWGRTVSIWRGAVTGTWAGSQMSCVDMCVNIWIWISSLIDFTLFWFWINWHNWQVIYMLDRKLFLILLYFVESFVGDMISPFIV